MIQFSPEFLHHLIVLFTLALNAFIRHIGSSFVRYHVRELQEEDVSYMSVQRLQTVAKYFSQEKETGWPIVQTWSVEKKKLNNLSLLIVVLVTTWWPGGCYLSGSEKALHGHLSRPGVTVDTQRRKAGSNTK